ncbi:MAG: tail assembly protein [Micrococcales bacterium]|nr:tail assembly protein [Micrococcales bacterium]
MLREIRLYGRLAKFIGKRVLRADVSSAAEAVRFLVTNWPHLEAHMADQYYRVSLGSEDIASDDLHNPIGQETIRITPVLAGAGAVGRIIAGVALIALTMGIGAIASAGVTLGGFAGIGTVGTAIVGVGATLVLGGVAQLISPVPQVATGPDSTQDPRKTFSFSGIQNTSRQGTPVPICYGETIVGSIVISAGIDTVQVAV